MVSPPLMRSGKVLRFAPTDDAAPTDDDLIVDSEEEEDGDEDGAAAVSSPGVPTLNGVATPVIKCLG